MGRTRRNKRFRRERRRSSRSAAGRYAAAKVCAPAEACAAPGLATEVDVDMANRAILKKTGVCPSEGDVGNCNGAVSGGPLAVRRVLLSVGAVARQYVTPAV